LSQAWQDVLERKNAAVALVSSVKGVEGRRQAEIRQIHDNARSAQLNDYLDRFFIAREAWPRIPKSILAALASYGIETAADVTQADVLKVPGIGEIRARILLDWRARREKGFRFDAARADHSDRLKLAGRRFDGERRQHERNLLRVKSQVDALCAALIERKHKIEQEQLAVARQFAQVIADADALQLALGRPGAGSAGVAQQTTGPTGPLQSALNGPAKNWRRWWRRP
jgi:DNA-binding helix-hairpin-helix protein with protein kinase domain